MKLPPFPSLAVFGAAITLAATDAVFFNGRHFDRAALDEIRENVAREAASR